MLCGVIAECGNHHLGDLSKAKELITAAKECGAHYVKMQLIDTMEFKGGSMPREFYRTCDLGMAGYMECVEHARQLDIPIFFSVFGTKYMDFLGHHRGMPYKISGEQFKTFNSAYLQYWNDNENHHVVVSIPKMDVKAVFERRLVLSNMTPMYVSPYLEAPDFTFIGELIKILRKPVGYSDHTVGIDACKAAITTHGCSLIEKHFNLFGKQEFSGFVYRDSVHAASAGELKQICHIYEERFNAVRDLQRL